MERTTLLSHSRGSIIYQGGICDWLHIWYNPLEDWWIFSQVWQQTKDPNFSREFYGMSSPFLDMTKSSSNYSSALLSSDLHSEHERSSNPSAELRGLTKCLFLRINAASVLHVMSVNGSRSSGPEKLGLALACFLLDLCPGFLVGLLVFLGKHNRCWGTSWQSKTFVFTQSCSLQRNNAVIPFRAVKCES